MVSRRATEPGGFSLLEMVVVLAIMGLLGALTLPSLRKIAERTGFSLDRQDVERQLDQLPEVAAMRGKALVLTSSPNPDYPVPAGTSQQPYPIKLPAGWQIEVEAPISYRYDGTCSGGRLRLIMSDEQSDYLMNPPLCELRPGR